MLFQMDGERRAEMKAIRRLDVLENHLVQEGQVHEGAEGGGAVMDTGAGDSEVKVRGTLLRHIDAWEAAGAGAFAPVSYTHLTLPTSDLV